jgi:hypothetical protein
MESYEKLKQQKEQILAKATNPVIAEILGERARQDAQWGGPAHDDKHLTDDWFDYIRRQMYKVEEEDSDERQAFVKIASLAVAAIKSIDRRAARDLPADPTLNSSSA